MKISKEVESLLWSAAESRDPKAMEDFVSRFPHLKGELARRSELVRRMRVAKPEVVTPGFVYLPPAVPVNPWKARWPWGGAALGFAAIALAVVVTNRESGPPNHDPSSWRQVDAAMARQQQAGASAATTPSTSAPWTEKTPQPNNPTMSQRGNVGADSSFAKKTSPQSDGVYDEMRRPMSPEDARIDVSFADLPLDIALRTLALQAKVEIQIAPPIPEGNITEEFRSQSVMQILDALGKKYGFTAFRQEPGRILVIPATDNERKQASQGGGDPRSQ